MSEKPGPVGPSTSFRPMPDRKAQQDAARKKNIKVGLWSLGAIALVTFSMVWNPPTGRVHSFTSASDYKASSDSGCTNSGDGCHGDESAYKDFNDYHPNATCTTCHEYQGVGCIPCHSPNGHECQSCHDGTMDIAADRNRITDPYPKGHYRETTHTAMGTDMTLAVRGTDDGEAQAACKQCHSRDLYEAHQKVPVVEKSEYGDSVGCGECHNDTRAFGLAQVKSDWKKHRCEDCHTPKSSSPMHSQVAAAVEASGPASCGDTGAGCHDDTNLHSLHADAPEDCSSPAKKGDPGCHDLSLQSHEPTVTACGAGEQSCHGSYVNEDYSHKADKRQHSAGGAQASSVRFGDSSCGDCHQITDDGMSLVAEHQRPDNSIASASSGTCDACHNATDATVDAVLTDWQQRESDRACEACHTGSAVTARHTSEEAHSGRALTPAGTPSDAACMGSGCHNTLNLQTLHEKTGCTTSGCHQATGSIFGENKGTCGGSDAGSACHADVHKSYLAKHTAGKLQYAATYYDAASDSYFSCGLCHDMRLVTEHSRSNSQIAGGTSTVCTRCHEATDGTREVVAGRWSARLTTSACTTCHGPAGGVDGPHTGISDVHFASQVSQTDTVTAGSCVTTGCHLTDDVRVLHRNADGCLTEGCHTPMNDIRGKNVLRCGGTSAGNCHSGATAITATTHQDHSADLTGTVKGVTYMAGANVGCFGCHYADLTLEHSQALQAGSMEGGGSNTCRICHAGVAGRTDINTYASSSAVRAAIAANDRRCIACHKRGSADDAGGVASPHSNLATDLVAQPVGSVWTDPLQDWKTALNAPTGGGHNALSAAVVGASRDKDFPTTDYSVDATSYSWALPNNDATTTAWLRTGRFNGTETAGLPLKNFPSATTTEGIKAAMVTCEDCHVLSDPTGPQGASVRIGMDPAYSQTEYANPTPGTYQFDPFNLDGATSNNPAGYKPVICVKCHLVYVRKMENTSTTFVGGFSRHSTHRSRHDTNPSPTVAEYEYCIDCHVRIPHAWKRPRLLVRTIATTMSPEGVAPDTLPYVRNNHQGLTGVLLQSFANSAVSMSDKSCSAGLCEATHAHARSMPATQAYWP